MKIRPGFFGSNSWPPVEASTLRPATLKWIAILRASSLLRGAQRLGAVGDDIVGIFETDREPDHVLAHAGLRQRLFIHLAMGGRGRMQDQGLRIADIGEMRGEAQRLDEAPAGLAPALH